MNKVCVTVNKTSVIFNNYTPGYVFLCVIAEGVLCGDLVCSNGGECLDDFVCICPSDYTGSQCETRISMPIISLNVFEKRIKTLWEWAVIFLAILARRG